jgi:hypothetical protein
MDFYAFHFLRAITLYLSELCGHRLSNLSVKVFHYGCLGCYFQSQTFHKNRHSCFALYRHGNLNELLLSATVYVVISESAHVRLHRFITS